ncbi:hypothetical protein ACFX13_030201 [Malus domestica]
MDFFTAETDTTAISVEWALAELINHPKVLNKAREEIERFVGNGRLLVESDGPNLPYIQAIIKETLRLLTLVDREEQEITEKQWQREGNVLIAFRECLQK